MTEEKSSFVFYGSWLKIIEENYPDDIAKQRELLHNIILYGIKGESHKDVERMFLQQAFFQIDSAQERHERRVEAGRKGGKSGTGNAKKRYGNKNASKTQANDNVNGNVNEHLLLSNDNRLSGKTVESVFRPTEETSVDPERDIVQETILEIKKRQREKSEVDAKKRQEEVDRREAERNRLQALKQERIAMLTKEAEVSEI